MNLNLHWLTTCYANVARDEEMERFERVYQRYVGGREDVARNLLKPILSRIMGETLRRPINPPAIKTALLELAQFLTSPEGRTLAHLAAVDHFFADWDELWADATEHIPQQIKDVFETVGLDLHGGLDQPDHHTTPEQPLEMVRNLQV